MKIKGYTLHGDYYLANKVIPKIDGKGACEAKEEITLPNGKKVIAHTLSKEELESIPEEKERKCGKWYWTSTPSESKNSLWYVSSYGGFIDYDIGNSDSHGGVRLGFKNPF